jgi:hypothetical protein
MDLVLPPKHGRGDFARRAAGCVRPFPAQFAVVAPGFSSPLRLGACLR